MYGEIGALTRQKCSVFLLQEYSIALHPIQESCSRTDNEVWVSGFVWALLLETNSNSNEEKLRKSQKTE